MALPTRTLVAPKAIAASIAMAEQLTGYDLSEAGDLIWGDE